LKKMFIFAAVLVLIASISVGNAAAADDNLISDSASASILIDAETGDALYGHDSDLRLGIASTTKILTALVVLENCSSTESVEILPEYTGIEGSSIYLVPGETLTVKELLYGLMLESGNDAAVALACYVSGSIEDFASLMNERAEQLGCTNSHFVNPHGLDDEEHYSTAADLAKIAAAAMDNAELRDIVSTKSITVAGRSFVNHNKLLWTCDGVIGLKTGYTMSCGRTLVTCAQRGDMTLICVTLGDHDDWADHAALYDWAFANFTYAELPEAFDVPVISGIHESVRVVPETMPKIPVCTGEHVEVKVNIHKFLYAPVYIGASAGSISVLIDGEERQRIKLLCESDVSRDEGNLLTRWEKIKWAWYFANKHGTKMLMSAS